jgi:hypothetical protein
VAVKVELRYATLPSLLRLVAVHYWFVVFDETGCHRWEVWQTKNAGGRSIGHVHCDLKPAEAGVGGGPSRLAAEWTGEAAENLRKVLQEPESYPFCQNYRYWPGPNSNTFAAWVLRKAGVQHELGPMALGKRYPVV